MRHGERLLFMLGIVDLGFLGGIAVDKCQYWSYGALDHTKDTTVSLLSFYFPSEGPIVSGIDRTAGGVRWERGAMQDGPTLIPRLNDSGPGAILVDMESRIRCKLARNTHHDLEAQPDGKIMVLAQDDLEEGVPMGNDVTLPAVDQGTDALWHANNIQVIATVAAAVFPMGSAGDCLASFLYLNVVVVVD